MSSSKGTTAGGRATTAKREKYTPTGGGGGGPPAGPANLEELRAALVAESDEHRRTNIARQFLRDHGSAGTETVDEGWMHGAEEMHSLVLGGVTYKYSGATFGVAAASIRERLAGDNKDIPRELSRHTHTIIFSTREGQELEGGFGMSAASASRGTIVNYGRDANITLESHEMAHNMATARYGTSTPSTGSDFYFASVLGEHPPTKYGGLNRAEDFAESVRMYVQEPAKLKTIAPRRYDIVKRMLEDPGYGG